MPISHWISLFGSKLIRGWVTVGRSTEGLKRSINFHTSNEKSILFAIADCLPFGRQLNKFNKLTMTIDKEIFQAQEAEKFIDFDSRLFCLKSIWSLRLMLISNWVKCDQMLIPFVWFALTICCGMFLQDSSSFYWLSMWQHSVVSNLVHFSEFKAQIA